MGRVKTPSVSSLARRLDRVSSGRVSGAVDEFIQRRQPFHMGGMSDPFPPLERRERVSRDTMRVLAENDYPTIISTKSELVASDEYLDVLRSGVFQVQLSISSVDDDLMRRIDLGVPPPSARIETIRRLGEAGIPTSCRIQPILPTREADALEVLEAAADAGASHVGAEHLKLPIENTWKGTRSLQEALGSGALRAHREQGVRVGREWVLPVSQRIEMILRLREAAHRLGLTFGAADNDLLPLSDGTCCCSGADFHSNFDSHFTCNFTEAVRKGLSSGVVSYGLLADEWCPEGTAARFVNSRSRIPSSNGRGAGIRAYLRHGWNGSPNGASVASFYGVSDSGEIDADDMRIYKVSDELRQLTTTTIRAAS